MSHVLGHGRETQVGKKSIGMLEPGIKKCYRRQKGGEQRETWK